MYFILGSTAFRRIILASGYWYRQITERVLKKAAPEEKCMLQGPNYDPISMRTKTCTILRERIHYDFLVSIARGNFLEAVVFSKKVLNFLVKLI